jgi:sensor histidine kinase regulating citrate/malate metabolism
MSTPPIFEKQYKAKAYVFHPLMEALLIGGGIFVVVFTVSYFIYVHALDAQKGEIREGMVRVAKTVATILDGKLADLHKTFKTRSQEKGADYARFTEPLKKILACDKTIAFIYTVILKDNKVYFVVDPTPEGDANGDGIDDKSHIMQPYPEADAQMLTALREHRAVPTKEPYTDRWGSFMSAYAPFYDSNGQFVGIVGIDITAKNYFARLRPMVRSTVRAMVAGFFVSFMVGALVWFMRNFAAIINKRRIEVISDVKLMKKEITDRVELGAWNPE